MSARLRIFVVSLVIVAAALAFVLSGKRPVEEAPTSGVFEEEIGEAIQSVALVFADRRADRMVEERREIVVPEDRSGRAKRVLEELAAGPENPAAAPTLPAGTRILSVFFDDTGGAYVDFSEELVTRHPGGSTGELFTIRSVVQTLARNFPGVKRVRFLVEGEEIETIAGHIDATVAFDVDQYR